MRNKLISLDEVVDTLEDGMTIGIGGWGSRRKPMSMVRAIMRSNLRDLTVVSYGGPDVGLLAAAGKIRKLVYGFVSLDSIPLDPHFRAARERGEFEVAEYDEGMILAGLRAAGARLPFQPIRAGIGSDVPALNPDLPTVRSPFSDGEELLAMPALRLDAALVHLNHADVHGNGQYLGPDPYFDDLLCMAADRGFLSCERIVPTEQLRSQGPLPSLLINRAYVHGVVDSPGGAHFTSCVPDYPRDEAFQRDYVNSARDAASWRSFRNTFLDGDEQAYQDAVAASRQKSEESR